MILLCYTCSIECSAICREFVGEKGKRNSDAPHGFSFIPICVFLCHSHSPFPTLLLTRSFLQQLIPFLAHISYLLSPFLPPSSRGIHSCHSHSKPRLPRAAGQTVVFVCVCAHVRVYGCGPPCLQLSPKYFYIYDLALLVHSWSIQV